MHYWLWSITKENWEILKNKRVWATYNKNVCNMVKNGDMFIFYVKGTMCFKGIFQAVSDWYETDEITWYDEVKENKVKYPYQIRLKPILLGEASYRDLIPELEFVEKKHAPQVYIFGTRGGPVNFRKPLKESDYNLIYKEMQKKPTPIPTLVPTPTAPTPPITPVIEEEQLTHEKIEGILLELGNLLGFDTYTANKSKEYEGKKLGDISTLKDIPSFTYPRILDIVREVDVIWFKDDFPRYCFEVEHTTGITKGLLRLFQIRELLSKFFIIAPSSRISKFETEMRKDPFYRIRNRYSFKSYKELIEWFETAKKYHAQKKSFLGEG